MGANLAITGRDRGRAEGAAREIRAAGGGQVDVLRDLATRPAVIVQNWCPELGGSRMPVGRRGDDPPTRHARRALVIHGTCAPERGGRRGDHCGRRARCRRDHLVRARLARSARMHHRHDPDHIVARSTRYGCRTVGITTAIAFTAVSLPTSFPDDPADSHLRDRRRARLAVGQQGPSLRRRGPSGAALRRRR